MEETCEKKKELISVIIPVYNVKPYIRQCLDSVIRQSYKNLEIILVDDGSTDGSGEICNQYAEKDSRIRVIHQSNRGLSEARNAGLELATGKYIMFVDSDDWVEPDFCRIPYELSEKHSADIVIFPFRKAETWKQPKRYRESDGLKNKNRALWLLHHSGAAAVWNKLYKKELFLEIRFPADRVYEDIAVTHKLILKAERIYYTNNIVLYHYRSRAGSITTENTHKTVKDYIEVSMDKAADLDAWGYPAEAESIREKAYWTYLKREGQNSEYSKECKAYIEGLTTFPEFLSWRGKVMFILLKKEPVLFDTACKLFGKRAKK